MIKNLLYCLLFVLLTGCAQENSKTDIVDDKKELLSLERKWLDAEFALDTAYLSTIIDTSFLDISGSGVHNKQEALAGMYNNISQKIKDSVIVDSFTLEDPIVNLHGDAAVVTFIVHTYGNNKGVPAERKTRFYDVWIKRHGKWMAVASQGSKVNE